MAPVHTGVPYRPPTLRFGPTAQPIRPSPSLRGYGRDWQRARKAFLAAHPFCSGPDSECEREEMTVPAEEVDHRVAISAGGDRFDHSNLQALCKACHSKKTVRADGGLGHARGTA
jgi:5-methylcytosine-specific restriction protein A